jgi:hypothetical protein
VVSSAALIMVAVFSAFAALSLIDATIVRGILFPATLALLGGCAWYAPRRLRRPAPHGEPAGFRFSALGTHRPVRSVVSAGPASGCSGGAAVWLDAVLAEQVVQAAEFATQPLLTGKHLLFPVAQRRGGLDVSRGERGLLLLLRPGKLVRSVREVSQDRLLDDPGLWICCAARGGPAVQPRPV